MTNNTQDIALRVFIKKCMDDAKSARMRYEAKILFNRSILNNKKAIKISDLDLLLN